MVAIFDQWVIIFSGMGCGTNTLPTKNFTSIFEIFNPFQKIFKKFLFISLTFHGIRKCALYFHKSSSL